MEQRPKSARRTATGLSSGLALALVLSACGSAADRATNASSTAPRSVSTPMNSENVYEGVATELTPVYWTGRDENAGYLFREFRNADESDTVDPVAEAVETMTALTPLDEDYRSLWAPVQSVGTSVSPDGTITVDLPDTAFANNLSEADAELALQQLVYTVSAAAVTAGLLDAATAKEVRVLVDGESGYKAFGSVELNEPIARDASVAAPVWLIDPQTGTESGSPLTLFGRVLPEYSSAHWEVLPRGEDEPIETGNIEHSDESQASTAGTEFRINVDVPAGEYMVRVTAENENGDTLHDDHAVTVVPD